MENLREREYSIAVSHWTEMVRSGQKGMQFLTEGRYVANVVDGKVTLYGGRSEAIRYYWTGHAKSSDGEVVRQTITDRYIKMAKDTKFRADVAERIGLGFELPKAETVEVVPSVPRFQKTEVTVSI